MEGGMMTDTEQEKEEFVAVEWSISMGSHSAIEAGIFYVTPGTSEEEIEQTARDLAFECIDWGYEVKS